MTTFFEDCDELDRLIAEAEAPRCVVCGSYECGLVPFCGDEESLCRACVNWWFRVAWLLISNRALLRI